jgi:hypothetical protein
MSCSSTQRDDTSRINPDASKLAESGAADAENTYLARENLDLPAVGNLLEKSKNAQEFEYLLNSDERVNNLDLNGDGNADYISVAEYDDSTDNQRGFTLFDRFGADEIQEIARIIFDRDGFNSRDGRILLTGNEQLYGDNYYYETNWQERNLPIADWVYENRDNHYESPYYYGNYPANYEAYRVIETPVYRTRIEQYFPAPVFIKTARPTITQIKIKSRYNDRSADKIFAKLAKPTKEQKEFRQNNPNRPEFVPVKNGKMKNDSFRDTFRSDNESRDNSKRSENKSEKSRKENNEKPQMREKPNKPERENTRPQNPAKVERPEMKRPRPENNGKQNGGGKPNGKGNGNGGGNGKGNGGGKGGGKKN